MTAGRRVVVASHYAAPHVGGIETVVQAHAQGLAARGWDVTVCTSRLADDCEVESRDGFRVRRSRAWNVLERRLRVPVPLVSPVQMWHMWRSRPDVVVAHGHTYLSSVYATVVALLRRCPLVVVQHSPWVEYPFVLNVVEAFADRTVGRFVLHRASRVLVVSAFTGRFVSSFAPGAALQVVYSGVDRRFVPSPPRVCPERLRVVTLRRLVPRQGVDVLVRAWIESGCGEFADLVVGGDGPQRGVLERLAADDSSISFVGRVPDGGLEEFYSAADVFVLPSSSGEGFGLVAAEALASGRPVVATCPGGPSELVRDGVDGVLVPAGDVGALGGALSGLLSDHVRRVRMSQAAAERDLSWDVCLDEFASVLADV